MWMMRPAGGGPIVVVVPFLEPPLTVPRFPAGRAAGRALVALLAVGLYGGFAYRHVHHWLTFGNTTGLVVAVQETVIVCLFLLRRATAASSRRPLDWVAAVLGTFAPLLLAPAGWTAGPLARAGTSLQLAGAALAVVSTLHLGRSFGVVAANRGVQQRGLYRVVRHPLYVSYLISHAGYLLGAVSAWNVFVLVVTYLAQAHRIVAEERTLSLDASYVRYTERVRYRLVPRVY